MCARAGQGRRLLAAGQCRERCGERVNVGLGGVEGRHQPDDRLPLVPHMEVPVLLERGNVMRVERGEHRVGLDRLPDLEARERVGRDRVGDEVEGGERREVRGVVTDDQRVEALRHLRRRRLDHGDDVEVDGVHLRMKEEAGAAVAQVERGGERRDRDGNAPSPWFAIDPTHMKAEANHYIKHRNKRYNWQDCSGSSSAECSPDTSNG